MSDLTLREAAQEALRIMESFTGEYNDAGVKAVIDLRAALSQQPAPVAWIRADWSGSGERTLSFSGPPDKPSVRDAVVNPAWTPLYAAPQPAPVAQQDEPVATYTSTQATNCAGCGERKHTPLRIDAMGGYVCLTCIDQKLGALLGEFGYAATQPAQLTPIPDARLDELRQANGGALNYVTLREFRIIARSVERAHKIGGAE